MLCLTVIGFEFIVVLLSAAIGLDVISVWLVSYILVLVGLLEVFVVSACSLCLARNWG